MARHRSLILFVLMAVTATALGQTRKIVHERVYNRLATIKGHVELENRDGKVVASGQYLVFRRSGCKDYLLATFADENGDYKIIVRPGRYEVIVYNPSQVNYDMLAPNQPRFVEAKLGLKDTEFNIKLRVE